MFENLYLIHQFDYNYFEDIIILISIWIIIFKFFETQFFELIY